MQVNRQMITHFANSSSSSAVSSLEVKSTLTTTSVTDKGSTKNTCRSTENVFLNAI